MCSRRALAALPRAVIRSRRALSIKPDRFSSFGGLDSGLSVATLLQEQEEKPAHLWESVVREAERILVSEHKHARHLQSLLETRVLPHQGLPEAVSAALAKKLVGHGMSEASWRALIDDVILDYPGFAYAAACDLARYVEIDPAADGHLSVFLFFKGFQAVQCARIAHHLWREEDAQCRLLARMLQCRSSHTWGVDIHPGAVLGHGVTLDHATGIVIGETAVVGNNVGFMHDVTLGATGKSPDHDLSLIHI